MKDYCESPGSQIQTKLNKKNGAQHVQPWNSKYAQAMKQSPWHVLTTDKPIATNFSLLLSLTHPKPLIRAK